MMLSTPPLTSDSAHPSSSQDLASSSGPATPQNYRNPIRFLHCAFDSDDEDDEDEDGDVEMFELRRGKAPQRFPLTPTRGSRVNGTSASEKSRLSPSKFVIKGTVTPSRAAPLFVRFANGGRKRLRSNCTKIEADDTADLHWADENVYDTLLDVPSSKSTSPLKSSSLSQSHMEFRSSSFIPQMHNSLPPLMPLPTSLSRRHRMVHTDTASMMHALRSNNLAHMSFASSARGTAAFATGSRGVLGAIRSLGAGVAGGAQRSVSQRPFHNSFCTTSTPAKDLFTLPSAHEDQRFSHPLCAEYANSARCLTGSRAQWLALGSNEGQLFLLDTSGQTTHFSSENTPSWQAHDGSVFEVQWRSDDQQIASGGSDYKIRVWDSSSGQAIRTFGGHRGTPRTIAWDPDGRGNLLASGGRDGAIHVYDTRTANDTDAVVSIWGAHAPKADIATGRRRRRKIEQAVRGITSLAYVPGRAAHTLCSAGCGDGALKVWDLRNVAATTSRDSSDEASAVATVPLLEQGVDVSTHLRSHNKSSHGISSIVTSSSTIFAACTDGCIYTLSAASLSTAATPTTSLGLPVVPLFDAAQRGNTLYARMSLHDDERTLALGCNSGVVTVWDAYAASSAASELAALGEDLTDMRNSQCALSGYAEGHDQLVEWSRPAVLQGGHRSNFEINAISWAHTEHGPTLASVSDDLTIRLWRSSQNL
jgi:denticleless